MKTVFILEHSYEIDQNEETKFIGIYLTHDDANQAVKRLKDKPGFIWWPDNFVISEREINKDSWNEGFSRMTTIEVKDRNDAWKTVQAEVFPNNTYQIIELYENDLLGPFRHLDIVICEEKENCLYAIELANKIE